MPVLTAKHYLLVILIFKKCVINNKISEHNMLVGTYFTNYVLHDYSIKIKNICMKIKYNFNTA